MKIKTCIILLGGKGTRFIEKRSKPKQLVILNKNSILMNIVLNYNKYGINYFVLPLGNKKSFFYDYFSKSLLKKYNINLITKKNYKDVRPNKINILLFNAGVNSSKLERILKSIKFCFSKYFFLTYGDGVANISIKKKERFFLSSNFDALVSCVKLRSNYGHLRLGKKKVNDFIEKPFFENPVNIGFYIFKLKIFEKIENIKFKSLEKDFLPFLAKKKKLTYYIHKGFFFNIDSKNDLEKVRTKYKNLLKKL
jgi:glucose-1-phosphate cytidylyltransferase